MALFGALTGIQAGMAAGAGTPPMPGRRRNAGSSLRAGMGGGSSSSSFAGAPPPPQPQLQQVAESLDANVKGSMREAERYAEKMANMANTPPKPAPTPVETKPDGYAGVPRNDSAMTGLNPDYSEAEAVERELEEHLSKGHWMNAFDGFDDARNAKTRDLQMRAQIKRDQADRKALAERNAALAGRPELLDEKAGLTPEGQMFERDPRTGKLSPSFVQTRDEWSVSPEGGTAHYTERAPRMARSLAEVNMRGVEDAAGDARGHANAMKYLDAQTAAAQKLITDRTAANVREARAKANIKGAGGPDGARAPRARDPLDTLAKTNALVKSEFERMYPPGSLKTMSMTDEERAAGWEKATETVRAKLGEAGVGAAATGSTDGMPPAVLEKIKALPAGKTVTLNNGQVWKSVNGKATRVR